MIELLLSWWAKAPADDLLFMLSEGSYVSLYLIRTSFFLIEFLAFERFIRNRVLLLFIFWWSVCIAFSPPFSSRSSVCWSFFKMDFPPSLGVIERLLLSFRDAEAFEALSFRDDGAYCSLERLRVDCWTHCPNQRTCYLLEQTLLVKMGLPLILRIFSSDWSTSFLW